MGTADEGMGEHTPSEPHLFYSIVGSVLIAIKDASGIGVDDRSGSERPRFCDPNPTIFEKRFWKRAGSARFPGLRLAARAIDGYDSQSHVPGITEGLGHGQG